jgi:hypothetical protein
VLITSWSYGRSMTRLPTPDQLLDLAEAVVATGFEAQRIEIATLVSAARRLGVRPVLTDIVAEPDAPRPVRERALGRIVVALSAAADVSASPPTVTTGAASAA